MNVKYYMKRYTVNEKPQEKKLLADKIELSEINEAISSTKNGKSPGIDRLRIEFYNLKLDLLKAL